MYLRLREANGTTYFEVSMADPIALDDVTLELRAGLANAAAADSGTFDDVNLP